MPGKPGRSGGKRPGSGRPPQSWRLEQGAVMALYETIDGRPIAITRIATVHVDSRSVLILRLDDGSEIKLVR